MKAKLCWPIAVVMLLSVFAFPTLAAGDVEMWVSRARLAYVGRSSTGTDAIVALVHVRDSNQQRVEGAAVTVQWTLPDGTRPQETAYTSVQGTAQFTVWVGRGVYQLRVLDVTKDGYTYTPVVTAATPITAR